MSLKDLFDHVEHNQQTYLDALFTLLRQPSISAQNVGIRECAVLLADMLKQAGMDVKIMGPKAILWFCRANCLLRGLYSSILWALRRSTT
jgi:acetylornithine deacetylase/succinyl-diaminopimelate desuccinylase-like protein